MATIPFIGPSYNLRRRHHSLQRAVNLVPVPLEPGNERTAWVFKDAPGLVAFSGAAPPVVVGLRGFRGMLAFWIGGAASPSA